MQAGQLCELLVMQGHLEDAARLQAAVSSLAASALAACEEAAAHPLPPMPSAAGDSGREKAGKTAAAAWKWDILREPENAVSGIMTKTSPDA